MLCCVLFCNKKNWRKPLERLIESYWGLCVLSSRVDWIWNLLELTVWLIKILTKKFIKTSRLWFAIDNYWAPSPIEHLSRGFFLLLMYQFFSTWKCISLVSSNKRTRQNDSKWEMCQEHNSLTTYWRQCILDWKNLILTLFPFLSTFPLSKCVRRIAGLSMLLFSNHVCLLLK